MKRRDQSPEKYTPLSPRARLGTIGLFVEPELISLRSADLADAIARLHPTGGVTNHSDLALMGPHLASADTALGALLVVSAMIAVSVFHLESSLHPEPPDARHSPLLRFFSAGGWLSLAAVDLFMSVMGATGPWQNQVVVFGLEVSKIMLETMLGILIAEHTLPEMLSKWPSISSAAARFFRCIRRK